MPTNLAERACECLRSTPGKRFKAREIAEWIVAHYPAEARARKKDGATLGDAQLVNRLTSEIGLNQARWQKTYPEFSATGDKPRIYYWAAAEKPEQEAVIAPVEQVTAPPASATPFSRRIFMIDRAAVLFVGLLVGAVIGLSFQTNGKPFGALLGIDEVSAETPRVAPPPPHGCTDTFPLSPRVITALRADRPIQIGVFGDSFGDGVWAGAVQHLHGRQEFKVFQFSKESTGFTRYASLDLLDDAKKKIADQPIDIALIDFGTNDTQGVWAAGKAAPYMSSGWQRVIGDRASALVHMFEQRGIAVGWVGLPRMREEKFDRQIQLMNEFYANLMCRLNVPFVNPVAISEDASHHFAKELVDGETGQPYLARADDGIHMTVHGYRMMAMPLLKRIGSLAPAADTKAAN